MALINCPECNHEISDTAKSCPNCGYRIGHVDRSEQIKKYIKLGGICIVAILIITIFYKSVTKIHTPFDELTPQMTKEDVHNRFGEPDSVSKEYNIDGYSDALFIGLNGEINIAYKRYDDQKIDYVFWNYPLNEGEEFSDYAKQINKISDFYTKKYGAPKEEYGYTVWEDSTGQRYMLELDSNSKYLTLPPTIRIKYEPNN